jgi:hypothetical protein
LPRNLDNEEFTGEINKEICRMESAKVADDMVIAIDSSDIEAPFPKYKITAL